MGISTWAPGKLHRAVPLDLPNLLTLSRIFAIPLLVICVAIREPWADMAACALFSAAAITDYFDGKIARDRQIVSDFGRMLDPIADKLLVGAALMLLAGFDRLPNWALLPAIVIMLREILVSGLREYLAGLNVGLPVTALAKWKTGFQLTYLISGMIWLTLETMDSIPRWLSVFHFLTKPMDQGGLLMPISLFLAVALTVISGWNYVWSSRYLLKGS